MNKGHAATKRKPTASRPGPSRAARPDAAPSKPRLPPKAAAVIRRIRRRVWRPRLPWRPRQGKDKEVPEKEAASRSGDARTARCRCSISPMPPSRR